MLTFCPGCLRYSGAGGRCWWSKDCCWVVEDRRGADGIAVEAMVTFWSDVLVIVGPTAIKLGQGPCYLRYVPSLPPHHHLFCFHSSRPCKTDLRQSVADADGGVEDKADKVGGRPPSCLNNASQALTCRSCSNIVITPPRASSVLSFFSRSNQISFVAKLQLSGSS